MTPQQDKILVAYATTIAENEFIEPKACDGILALIDLVREHDAKLASTPSELDQLREQVARLTRERDEARAQLAAAREDARSARGFIVEKNREIDTLIQQRVGLLEQGHQEAREGIAELLDRQAATDRSLAESEDIALLQRAASGCRYYAYGHAADIARNWKPEGGAK